MKPKWYADNRDLVKWAVLFRLAERFKTNRILQIAYYRPSNFEKIKIDDHELDIPSEVIAHFRNMRDIENIHSETKVTVFDQIFTKDRNAYVEAVKTLLKKHRQQKCVVFLDPDTGLEPPSGKVTLKHTRKTEAKNIWKEIKPGDIFVFYQHRIRDKFWVPNKKQQLEKAIGVPKGSIKLAHGFKIASDVVFFYIQKLK